MEKEGNVTAKKKKNLGVDIWAMSFPALTANDYIHGSFKHRCYWRSNNARVPYYTG
ncbi:MAG: hypothetical protein QXV17_05745 [Candidatus Micrarchaeaceae archaeon]